MQLSILIETNRSGLSELVAELDAEARAVMGAGRDAALYASRAVLRRFQDEFGGEGPLSVRQSIRVRGYYRAVLRRVVFRRRESADRSYRRRAQVEAAIEDLGRVGVQGEALRTELVETLGLESATVDAVLERMAGAA